MMYRSSTACCRSIGRWFADAFEDVKHIDKALKFLSDAKSSAKPRPFFHNMPGPLKVPWW